MSFFSHLPTDTESRLNCSVVHNDTNTNFFEVEDDTNYARQNYSGNDATVTETQPKRKFISQFPSFKRNYNSHHSVEERDIDYASMPPPLPKIVSSDESEQTKQNCGDISRNDPPTNLIENIKTSSESIPYHDPHHKDDVILETITRTDTWQAITCLRTIDSSPLQITCEGSKPAAKSPNKRKAHWDATEKKNQEMLIKIRAMKEEVNSTEKTDIEQAVALEELKSRLLHDEENPALEDIERECKRASLLYSKIHTLLEAVQSR